MKDQTLTVNAREQVYGLRMNLPSPGLERLPCSHQDERLWRGALPGARPTHRGGLPGETATAWVWEPGDGTEQGSLSFCFPQRHILFNISFLYLSRSELCGYITCSNKLRIKNKHTRKTALCIFLTAPPQHTQRKWSYPSPNFPSPWAFLY